VALTEAKRQAFVCSWILLNIQIIKIYTERNLINYNNKNLKIRKQVVIFLSITALNYFLSEVCKHIIKKAERTLEPESAASLFHLEEILETPMSGAWFLLRVNLNFHWMIYII